MSKKEKQTKQSGGDAPQWEAPLWEAPQWEAPLWEAPVKEAPVEDAPQWEAPLCEAPVEDAPRDWVLFSIYHHSLLCVKNNLLLISYYKYFCNIVIEFMSSIG